MTADNLYLGVDGGGTKTEAVIADSTGSVIGRGLAGGSNPHNTADAQRMTNILAAIDQAKQEARLESNSSFTAACYGIAGLDSDQEMNRFQAMIDPLVKTSKSLVCNDGLIGFRSGTDSNLGICVIASTGSSCYSITPDGSHIKAGNWGYLLGDQGSGFCIGQEILKQAVKEFDGRRQPTDLMHKVIHHFEVDTLADLAQNLYNNQQPVSKIASLATLLSDPEYIHHPAIIAIATRAVSELFESLQAVADKIPPAAAKDFPIILTGKLFLAKNLITNPLIEKITLNYPTAHIILPEKSPVHGAVQIALTL
jgi:N-acetylglucosamine kinase-like BadF-type ATPase